METTIRIEGMHCGGCTKSVEKALGAVPGVRNVDVSLEKGTATVSANADIPIAALKEAIEDAGYDVVA